ncbi:ABC transporter substrate-binding protein [Glaciimonas soli]|uniref:Peptide ABC transporter substrate-binding protein n=1 Tax=Glaciimonas soli TaxID=2590999 RepID=A0A843YQU3_9BURK|nr:ABC transporter substrate-binding protein [Glaciimonas soli]MQR02139.1 peptide ABC transporter substrate-binding protein [Glaciimonas soli]
MLKFHKKLLPLVALLALMATSAPTMAVEKTFVGAFDVGPSGNAQKFNPLTASAGFSFYNKYFSTLTLYDVGLQNLSGDLADSWAFAPDGKSLTIHLRKGVKWHDGAPFTSKDVKFTLNLVRNPDSASSFASRLNNVTDIQTPNDTTVMLTLSSMDASLPDAFTSIMMVPEHLLGKIPAKELRNSDWWKQPVGTGPFKWVKYLPDQYVELDANNNFYRGRPKLDKLINRYFKDGSSASIALQAGEIQHTYLTLDQVKESQKNTVYNVISGPSNVLNYIGVNNNDPRFKDIRVRQAILMAIDRAAIVKYIYNSQAAVSNCVLSLPKYVPADLNQYGTNVKKAKQLLAATDWDKLNRGAPIELLTYYGDQVTKDVVSSLQAMLGEIGITIKPRFVDGPTFSKIVDAGNFTMVFAGGGNGPDPSVLAPLMDSAYIPPKGVNRMRVNLPELDALFKAGQQEADEAKRTEIYKNVCRMTNAKLPWIPLWGTNRFGGVAKNAQNVIWTPAPSGGRYQDFPENWNMQ